MSLGLRELKPAPSTPSTPCDRARPHFRGGGVGVCALATALAVVSLAYGDHQHAAYSAAVSAVAYAYVRAARDLSRARMARWGGVGIAVATFGYALFYPLGNTLLALSFPIALLFASLGRDMRLAAAAVIALVAAIVAYHLAVGTLVAPPRVPESVSAGLVVVMTMVMTWVTVSGLSQRLGAQIAQIGRQAADTEARERELAAQRRQLEELNVSLERSGRHLRLNAAERERQTAQYARELSDQQGITHAIHHDLREPLRNIVSFTQLIERRLGAHPEGAQVTDYLRYATDGGQRIARMLADLLRYTRREEEPFVAVDLARLAAEVAADLEDSLHRNGGVVEIAPGLPAVMGYETQLRQLLQNLIANALKFRRAGVAPRVALGPTAPDDGARAGFTVADNGIGIPADRLAEVFGLFNRVHGTEGYEGSGVGLALCRRIALAHGAEIGVTSEVGVGSVFAVAGLTFARGSGGGASVAVPSAPTAATTESLPV